MYPYRIKFLRGKQTRHIRQHIECSTFKQNYFLRPQFNSIVMSIRLSTFYRKICFVPMHRSRRRVRFIFCLFSVYYESDEAEGAAEEMSQLICQSVKMIQCWSVCVFLRQTRDIFPLDGGGIQPNWNNRNHMEIFEGFEMIETCLMALEQRGFLPIENRKHWMWCLGFSCNSSVVLNFAFLHLHICNMDIRNDCGRIVNISSNSNLF